ncbi:MULTISPECIES: methyltransferase domain-containing protein [unclassified Thiocapsa]|uniref:methyltransferase domain-containing protein n=1 Tax=unclassified Thiocapsa TaxID=2641286 RepID=UPI0035AEA43C
MHPTSLENMRKCYDRYVVPAGLEQRSDVLVLDIGGADINGNYRPIFSHPVFRYLTADLAAEGVDILLEDPYQIPLPDESVDIVLSGQMLEHCEYFWLAFKEMVRLMKPDGFLFLIAPSSGPIHRYPVDCYRFFPDAFAALARHADCRLEALWRDERGPWQDLVGVFRKTPLQPFVDEALKGTKMQIRSGLPSSNSVPHGFPPSGSPNAEVTAGQVHYRAILAQAHEILKPELYLEIGVRHGDSLALAHGPAVGVDCAPDVEQPLHAATTIIQATSDEFFEFKAGEALTTPPDLSFIDGMHLFEYALRDFMNVERWSKSSSLVIVDDIFPNHPDQATRERCTRVWTGDVWKLHACLAEERPDLLLLSLDTSPTGLLLIAGLDASNRTLWDRYNPIVNRYVKRQPETLPAAVIARDGALDPCAPIVAQLLCKLRELRDKMARRVDVTAELQTLIRDRR